MRISGEISSSLASQRYHTRQCITELLDGGDGRNRTADLLIANQSLSQLSYAPRLARILRAPIISVNYSAGSGQ